MKILIKYLFAFLILIQTELLIAQCEPHACDPQLTGFGFNVGCIDLNGNATLTLGWALGGGDITCTVPPNSWRIQISLPLTGIYGAANGIADINGPGFDWVYSDVNKTFNGVNNVQMNWLTGGTITINITGLVLTNCSISLSQSNIYIQPSILGGCPQAFNNQIANDALSAGKGVQSPLPVVLKSFLVTDGKCGEAILNWESASERNSDYYTIERSEDGKLFEPIHKAKSENKSSGAAYIFVDNSVSGGTRYYYRLKQTDIDGFSEELKLISIETAYCSGADVSMSLYPNPAMDKVFVSLKGFNELDNISLEVTNLLGKAMFVTKNNSPYEPNELKLNNLPAGIYNVRVVGFEDLTTKRFIKVE